MKTAKTDKSIHFTGAAVVVKSLVDLGVKHVFGYTGAAILPIMDELFINGIDIVVNSNEQSSGFAATGYSRSSNDVGVAVVTSGPAITNTLTSVADAYADSIPMIVISGQVSEHKIGTDSFQHIDVSAVFGPTAKKVFTLKCSDDIESIIKESYYLAKSGKPGPVVIDIPLNVQQKNATYQNLPIHWFEELYRTESHLSDVRCAEFFELLGKSKKPLLYLGGGVSSQRSTGALRRFNNRFHIPSVNTLMAKGVIDEDAPEAMGLLGMFGTPYANKIIQENDFFFALGVRWDDRVAEKVGFAIHSEIAYVDINPDKVLQIRKERNPAFSVIGDAATVLDVLTDYACRHNINIDIGPWVSCAVETKKNWPLNYRRDADILQQAEVLDFLNEQLPDNVIITTGVGNHQLLAAQYLRMKSPKSFLTSGSMATMGFGMPNAIGAWYANPDATVIVIDGDGSFRMNMGELHTIGMLGIPIKVLLLNNHSDGMVRNLENVAYEGRHSATQRPRDVNFAEIAQRCHFEISHRIEKRDDLKKWLPRFLSCTGPALLEVITDMDEALYPVVRPGSSYAEMNMGPYIRPMKSK